MEAERQSAATFSELVFRLSTGLGLVGLCAPLSYVHELGTIYMPSTHTADFQRPWGTHPEIDNRVAWASTRTTHDGYELSRQKKIQLLAKHIRAEDPNLPLRVCWGNGANCSKCDKCCVTMIGLAVEGLNPNNHGFEFSPATLSYMRKQFEAGRFNLSDTRVWILRELQTCNAPRSDRLEVDGLEEFFAWLRGVSIQRLEDKSRRSLRRTVKRFLENRPEPIGRSFRKAIGHPFP